LCAPQHTKNKNELHYETYTYFKANFTWYETCTSFEVEE